MRRQTSPHEVGSSAFGETEALRASASQSNHSVDGPNSLELATRGLLSADTDVGTLVGSKRKLSYAATPLHSVPNLAPKVSSRPSFE